MSQPLNVWKRAGWSPQKTADATDAYRAQFPVAEAWRVQQISDVNMLGYVTLPLKPRRGRR